MLRVTVGQHLLEAYARESASEAKLCVCSHWLYNHFTSKGFLLWHNSNDPENDFIGLGKCSQCECKGYCDDEFEDEVFKTRQFLELKELKEND